MYGLSSRPEYARAILLHMLYCLMYSLSIMAALWFHGDPVVTLVAVSLALPVALLPLLKFFRREITRSTMQIVFPVAAGAWLIHRFSERIPSDRFLIESLALAGYAFGFTLYKKDRGFFMLVCAVMLVYGGVYPRGIFIMLMPFMALLGAMIFYLSRTDALSRWSQENPGNIGGSRYSWCYLLPQLLLMFVFTVGLYALLPGEDATSHGFVASDFTSKGNLDPSGLSDWFETSRVISDPTGRRQASGQNPSAVSEHSQMPVSALTAEKGFSLDGSGSSTPGDELVFKVRCDSKLYWLAALYDEYNGDSWKTSGEIKGQVFESSWDTQKLYIFIRQEFEIRKWMSKSLFCAFMPSFCTANNYPFKFMDQSFHGIRLGDKGFVPNLPFIYHVVSLVPFSGLPATDSGQLWWESLDRGHYLKLPEGRISSRLHDKAAEVTAGAASDMDKAVRIRDYLRSSFSYTLTPEKRLPPDAEGADFMIFELRSGHCEYFACAMAVLARLAGLPSRVATGFSPGNFNLISREFEVYEYHAHAWTQIFIEGKGWLTFDATPQSAVPSRTTPRGIGMLKDPFGDEWRIRTPETAQRTQRQASLYLTRSLDNNLLEHVRNSQNNHSSAMDSLLTKIPADGLELKNTVLGIREKMLGDKSALGPAVNSFKRNMKAFFAAITSALKRLFRFLTGMEGVALLLAAAAAYPVYIIARSFADAARRTVSRRRCENLFDDAISHLKSSPEECVKVCYSAIRNMLELAGYPNSRKMELFDYGASLSKVSMQLSKNTLAVFHIYSRMSYSTSNIDTTDSEEALQRALLVRSELDNTGK
ncbi:MAG: transglutaminase domain-containing protein [Victivallales bacterium]|nr:transglutaminase domain-containing protein [Victivallales bacterium]